MISIAITIIKLLFEGFLIFIKVYIKLNLKNTSNRIMTTKIIHQLAPEAESK